MREVKQINIRDIVSTNSVNDKKVEGYAESFKENSSLQPITVRKTDDGKYELISGEKRYQASLYKEYETVEAIVLDKDDNEAVKLAIIEKLQKDEPNVIEQAKSMKYIMDEEDLTQSELALRLGYKQSTVANKLRLLKLPEYVQNALANSEITERHARALLNVPEDKIEKAFNTIYTKKYNVSKSEEYIKSLLSNDIHRKGVTGNVRIGVNTIQQAYDMCKKSGIDSDIKVTEYDDEIKIVIRMKK